MSLLALLGMFLKKQIGLLIKPLIQNLIRVFDEFRSTIITIYENSSKEDCLKIFNAHPELAVEKKLTEDSHKEQKGANLNRCNDEEFNEFKNLNIEYRSKFGFPFIVAVKGKNKNEILINFRKRIKNEIRFRV